jgi:hypothetical protein
MAQAFEQGILAHIRCFFQAGDRSPARAEIIREALELLNAEDLPWTARSVRLWFTRSTTPMTRSAATTAASAIHSALPVWLHSDECAANSGCLSDDVADGARPKFPAGATHRSSDAALANPDSILPAPQI